MNLTRPLDCRSRIRNPFVCLSNQHNTWSIRAATKKQCTAIQQRVFRTETPSCSSRYYRNNHRPCRYRGDHPITTPPVLPSNVRARPSSLHLIALMTSSQTRSHGSHGHSHGHGGHHHHHHHDNVYLTSKNKKDPGVRITRIGLLANLGMAIGKGFGGYAFHSQALVADAFHALTDLVSDFLTLATVSLSLKPPSERFPSGYGKVESIGALGVSGLLLCGGVLMGLNAMEVLLSQFFPEFTESLAHLGLLGHGHSHGHSHGGEVIGPNINAAWLAAGSIVIKESLYHATMKIAVQRKSSVLASNAVHHRVDSLTSIVALLTTGGAHMLPDASWLDPIGGLIISLMVIRAGWGNTRVSLLELADVSVDEEMHESVEKATSKALATIPNGNEVQFRNIQGIKSGQNYLMDVELGVPGSWTIDRSREVEEIVRERVGSRVRGVKRLRVRFVPNTSSEGEFTNEFIMRDVSPRSSPEPEDEPNNNGAGHGHSSGSNHSHGDDAHKRR